MVSKIWILSALLLLSKAEHLLWQSSENNPGCPLCKEYRRDGANFSSVVMVDGQLVIGAKNAIFYLDFAEETAQYFPDKTIPPAGFDACTNEYGQNQDDCQNYYKVILKLRNRDLFICGTEAFKPSCSVRSLGDLSYSTYNQDLSGICPASPHTSTTYIKLPDMQNVGFAATSIGIGEMEHAIQRIDLKYGSFGTSGRTKLDNFWLKAPEFIYTFEDGDYLYVLFKEIAAEQHPERIYSRVGRICKTDEGSQNTFFKDNFVTYVKARIYCPYSRDGSSPYTFDSISGAYFLNKTLYVLFTGSNSIVETGSVLCSFSIDNIQKAFSSNYRNFEHGMWRSYENTEPFTCTNTRSVSELHEEGLLMTQTIAANPRVLLYSQLELKTTVAARIQMLSDGESEDFTTIYAGATNGKVLKVGVSIDDYGEVRTTKVRVWRASAGEIKFLVKDERVPGAVYAVSQDTVTYLPLDSHCSIYTTCQTCQDAYPGCGWCYDRVRQIGTCERTQSCNVTEKDFYGPFSQCPALPEFAEEPTNVEIDLGETARFNCSSTAPQTTLKRWEKEKGHLPYDTETSDGGDLLITSASSSDIGCYRCVLRGVSGSVSSQEACLYVRISPQFSNLPPGNLVTVTAGDDVIIPCRATGNPAPQYTWRKLQGELPEGYTVESEGNLKLIRVINHDEGNYRCTASNSVDSISQDITLKVIGTDPESGKINSGEGYDLTIIAAAVGVVLIVILFVGIGVKVFLSRNNSKKGGSQYSSVPGEGEQNAAGLRYSSRCAGVPGSSLPTHLHTEMYSHPHWPPQSSTIAIPSRQHSGSPGFPGSLIDYEEQPPPPYHPTHLANLPETVQQEHQYDEINIMMQQHFHPEILSPNGYNSTFRINQGLLGQTTPPLTSRPPVPGRTTPPDHARTTPPQVPERANVNYDVMRRDSPHRLTPSVSPLATNTSPQSQSSTSPWGQNSDI